MPTFLAVVVATTVSLLIWKGMAATDHVALRAALQLVAWGVAYYFTKRTMNNLRP